MCAWLYPLLNGILSSGQLPKYLYLVFNSFFPEIQALDYSSISCYLFHFERYLGLLLWRWTPVVQIVSYFSYRQDWNHDLYLARRQWPVWECKGNNWHLFFDSSSFKMLLNLLKWWNMLILCKKSVLEKGYCEQSVVQKSSCRYSDYLNSFLVKTVFNQEELGKWNFNRISTLEDFFFWRHYRPRILSNNFLKL